MPKDFLMSTVNTDKILKLQKLYQNPYYIDTDVLTNIHIHAEFNVLQIRYIYMKSIYKIIL